MELFGDIKSFVGLLSKEKGLEPEIIKDAIEQAIVQASHKSLVGYEDTRCSLDLETGKIELFARLEVVDDVELRQKEVSLKDAKKVKPDAALGDFVEVPVSPENFGRIAAQSARQYVMQRLRDAERLKLYAAFKDRVGEIAPAQVVRSERRSIIVQLGSGEALLPFNECPYPTRLRPNDRLKVLITLVDPEARGHMVTVSRNHPQLVAKLFEQEVPEISDGIVEILGVAREPGVRSKIAVHSKNREVDPVGACVGMKGSRVQMVVRELEGERIDIVPWDADPAKFIQAALNPAKILTVNCNDEAKSAEVLVARGNLSLAIGRRGQNARLAAKLTGWKIDVRSEEEDVETATMLARAEIERRYLEDFLGQLEDLNEDQISVFGKTDFNTVERIAKCDLEKLARMLGSSELAAVVRESAADYTEQLRQMRESAGAEEPIEAAEEPQAAAPAAKKVPAPSAEAAPADAAPAEIAPDEIADAESDTAKSEAGETA